MEYEKTITFTPLELWEIRQAVSSMKRDIVVDSCTDCSHIISCECCKVDGELRILDAILEKLAS